MAKNLALSNGVEEFTINDNVVIRFNPTDIAFADKLYTAFEDLEAEEKRFRSETEGSGYARSVLQKSAELDRLIRNRIDAVFGDGVSDGLFGSVNAYAMADGLPLWANLLFLVIDQMDAGVREQNGLTSARIKKYTDKYKKKK